MGTTTAAKLVLKGIQRVLAANMTAAPVTANTKLAELGRATKTGRVRVRSAETKGLSEVVVYVSVCTNAG